MNNILIINASANLHDSFSRNLSSIFANDLHDAQINYRELGHGPIPHINERWIEADRKPNTNRTAQDFEILQTSDALIGELKQADIIVLASPMYNFSIPSSLKAYLDHILRFNETFTLASQGSPRPYKGLLEHKKLVLCLTRGGTDYGRGERNEHMDFQSGYLKMIFDIMGIEDVHEFILEGTKRNAEQLDEDYSQIKLQIGQFLDNLKP
ncbi:FMN-dependent NADH-azoreductase [compost metagenome]